jgi:putative endonuclease
MWKMYVVACADGSYYCGITTDIKRRIDEHNGIKKRGAKYTRSRRPVSLLYEESHADRSSASKAEAAFKKKNRKQKVHYLLNQNNLIGLRKE